MGRPPLDKPEFFEELFVKHGWDAKEMLSVDTPRFKRYLSESAPDLKQRRKNYILGRRLSSLKRGD